MKHLNHLPIWRDAQILMLEIEPAVHGFARYHKYPIGSEPRATARRRCQTRSFIARIRANPVGIGSGNRSRRGWTTSKCRANGPGN